MRTVLYLILVIFVLNLSSCSTRAVISPNAVVVVKTPPKNYKIVKIKGKRYYFWNGKHYRKTRRGYVVVRV